MSKCNHGYLMRPDENGRKVPETKCCFCGEENKLGIGEWLYKAENLLPVILVIVVAASLVW